MSYQQTYKASGHIRSRGMGGFLNPPTHPEHTLSVAGDGFYQSLSASVDCDWLEDSVRDKARKLLTSWEENKPALESPPVQEWIKEVMVYFRSCYNLFPSNPEGWNASNLTISQEVCPIDFEDNHAGVHHIRKYYPNFKLCYEHLTGKWGG